MVRAKGIAYPALYKRKVFAIEININSLSTIEMKERKNNIKDIEV